MPLYQTIKLTYGHGYYQSELLGHPTPSFNHAELIAQNNLFYEQFKRGAIVEQNDMFVRFEDGTIISLKVVEFDF